jgi:hypothetical protein
MITTRQMTTRHVPIFLAAAVFGISGGCARVRVDPIQVQTIHIVHDVNLNVDKALEDFFAFQEQQATTRAAATQPAASTGAVQ